MDLESLDADTVEQIFIRHGAQSVTLTDARDRPVLEPGPGETPLWRDTRITGLFPAGVDFGQLRLFDVCHFDFEQRFLTGKFGITVSFGES